MIHACPVTSRFLGVVLGFLVLSQATAAERGVGQGFPIGSGTPAKIVSVQPDAQTQVLQMSPAPPSDAGPAISDASVPMSERTISFSSQPRRQRQTASGEGSVMSSIWTALLCIILLCLGFFGILYAAKRYLPGHRQLFSHPAMEILGRTHVDPKRYISLLRVGKRILVVGVSPDDMSSLSEITDEQEVTEIMEVARPKTEMGLTIFQRLFQRHVLSTDAAETDAMAKEKAREIEEQMETIRQRVRAIKTQDKPARHLDAVG